MKDRRQNYSGRCYEAPHLYTVLLLMCSLRCSLSLQLLRIGTIPILYNGRYNRDLACTPVVLMNYEVMQVFKDSLPSWNLKASELRGWAEKVTPARLKKMYDCWSAFLKIENNCGRRFFGFVLSCLPNDQSFCAHSTSKLLITNLVLISTIVSIQSTISSILLNVPPYLAFMVTIRILCVCRG